MNIYKSTILFPYIEGDSLVGKPTVLTLADAMVEEIAVPAQGKTMPKITLTFTETDKRLILNKTNARTIIKLYGPETDVWKGKPIELYTEPVKAFGATTNAVRVRKPAVKA